MRIDIYPTISKGDYFVHVFSNNEIKDPNLEISSFHKLEKRSTVESTVRVYDKLGFLKSESKFYGSICRLNIRNLPPDIYFAEVKHESTIKLFKIVLVNN